MALTATHKSVDAAGSNSQPRQPVLSPVNPLNPVIDAAVTGLNFWSRSMVPADGVPGPSAFSIVHHSIKAENDRVFLDVLANLPSVGDDSGGESSDDDDVPIIYSRPVVPVAEELRPAAGKPTFILSKDAPGARFPSPDSHPLPAEDAAAKRDRLRQHLAAVDESRYAPRPPSAAARPLPPPCDDVAALADYESIAAAHLAVEEARVTRLLDSITAGRAAQVAATEQRALADAARRDLDDQAARVVTLLDMVDLQRRAEAESMAQSTIQSTAESLARGGAGAAGEESGVVAVSGRAVPPAPRPPQDATLAAQDAAAAAGIEREFEEALAAPDAPSLPLRRGAPPRVTLDLESSLGGIDLDGLIERLTAARAAEAAGDGRVMSHDDGGGDGGSEEEDDTAAEPESCRRVGGINITWRPPAPAIPPVLVPSPLLGPPPAAPPRAQGHPHATVVDGPVPGRVYTDPYGRLSARGPRPVRGRPGGEGRSAPEDGDDSGDDAGDDWGAMRRQAKSVAAGR